MTTCFRAPRASYRPLPREAKQMWVAAGLRKIKRCPILLHIPPAAAFSAALSIVWNELLCHLCLPNCRRLVHFEVRVCPACRSRSGYDPAATDSCSWATRHDMARCGRGRT
jgi:hypothetical protein